MKKIVITLFTLSICLASGNIQKQMDDLMRSLQYKYQISGPEDLYKLKTQQTPQHGRTASRDMGDLVGDWRMEEENMEVFITVGSDQSIPDFMTLMAMVEAEGSITATASDYVAELTYILDSSIMEGDDGGGDCDISCEDEYNDYNDYGIEPSEIYCECCHEDWPLEDICEDDGGGDGGGVEFQYGSVADLYADYGSVLESMGTGCDGCTGNLEEMDAVTSFDIAVQSEFENWANNYEFGEYYFQFIDENENGTYDGGEIYAVSCEGDESNLTVAYDGSVYELQFEYFWMDAYDFDWGNDDDGDREDISRNYDALTFAQDYVNDNSSDWGENAFDLESEFSLVVDGDYVSGGLGGDDPGNCEINWPEDPYKMAVYSFVSEYVLVEGGSVGCFLDDGDLDQTYADFVMGMENEWAGGGGGDDEPIFFEKEDYADVSDPANWDQITESVAITRADNQGLFNPYSESSYNELGEYGPAGTLWAPMSTEEATMLDTNVYTSWHAAMNNNPQSFIDETVSLWCLEEDKYYDIVMASWTNGNNGGGFSYWRYPADGHDEEDDGPDLLIMNMDLMEFFMVSFGMDLDSLDIENPTVIGFGFENMVMGLMFDETGVIELMADSEEAAAATSIDDTSITFANLSLYDSTGTALLTVTGTIGPGWIDFEAGVETPIDFFNEDGEGDDDREFYVSFSEDSTGMDIEVGYDDYYGEEYSDTSYFDWSATTDSLFLYFEGDDYYYYYYEDEADTMALRYMIIEDTLFASASFNPCEDDEYESYEECFGDMDLPGFDELVDVESFRINQETVFTSTVLTSIEPTNGELPKEFKLYAAYPNPFNPVTTIRFDVGSTSHESTLRIYDVSGRNVATLINGQLQPGSYEVQWDARGFASGIYFSELISGTKRHTQKMVLLK